MSDYSMGRSKGQSTIPPEGDAYNAQRQEEIYAAITSKATLMRRYAELVRDGAGEEEVRLVTEALAQIERDIPRIGQELAVSSQGRNLNTFLDRLDSSLSRKDTHDEQRHQEQKALLEVNAEAIKKLGTRLDGIETVTDAIATRLDTVEERFDDSVADRQQLHAAIATLTERLDTYIAGSRRGELDAIKEWIASIQAYLEPGMTPEKARERQQRYIEMIERHEEELKRLAERGGDGER